MTKLLEHLKELEALAVLGIPVDEQKTAIIAEISAETKKKTAALVAPQPAAPPPQIVPLPAPSQPVVSVETWNPKPAEKKPRKGKLQLDLGSFFTTIKKVKGANGTITTITRQPTRMVVTSADAYVCPTCQTSVGNAGALATHQTT